MWSETEQEALIEKYILGELTAVESVLFEEMQKKDADFAKKTTFYQDFVGSMGVLGNQTLKTEFQNLELKLAKAAIAKKSTNVLSNIKKQINYTLEQITALFLPVPNYELAMSYTHRSQGFKLISPKNGINCSENSLIFELETAVNQTLDLQIENNKQELVLQESIDENENFFIIDLPNDLQAGIYYWKLSQKTDTLIGNFYVQKDLMPS